MPYCSHGLCNSNSQYVGRPDMKNVAFFRFPCRIKEYQKLKRWVDSCNRLDFSVDNVGKNSFVCSKHFVGGRGPTDTFADPCFATETQIPSNRTRKRLKTTSPEELALLEAEYNSRANIPDNVAEVRVIPMTDSDDPEEQNPDQLQTKSDSHGSVVSIYSASKPSQPIQEDLFQTDNDSCNTPDSGVENDTFPQVLHVLPLDVPSVPSLELLYKHLLNFGVPEGWMPSYKKQCIFLYKITDEVLACTLKFNADLQLSLTAFGRELRESHPVSAFIASQKVVSAKGLILVLKYLRMWKTCAGNTEPEYMDLMLRKNFIKDCMLFPVSCSLRSASCDILIKARKNATLCKKCVLLKGRLKTAVDFRKKGIYSSRAHSKNMPEEELQRRLAERRALLNASSKKLARLRRKYEEKNAVNGHYVITIVNPSDEKESVDPT